MVTPSAENGADPVRGGKWAGRPLFALDADVTVYWPDVRPCYDARVLPPAVPCRTCEHPEGYDRLSGPCPDCRGAGVIPPGGDHD